MLAFCNSVGLPIEEGRAAFQVPGKLPLQPGEGAIEKYHQKPSSHGAGCGLPAELG